MADFTVEAKRVKAGNSLTQMETQAMNAINQLKQLKINIVAFKTEVNNDPDYAAEDATKVQAVIDAVLVEIDSI